MQDLPVQCPVCASKELTPSKGQNVILPNDPDRLPAGVLSYRCERGHVFVILPRSSAAGTT